MNIAILGAGALGCYYGARLVQAGHKVTFIMRSAYEPVQQHGLHINSIFGDVHLPQPRIARTPAECGPVDLVIVCWKTTCNHLLAEALPPLLHAGTRVLTEFPGAGHGTSWLSDSDRYKAVLETFMAQCLQKEGEDVHAT